ncbi:MAG: helix-turn-helix domain-containing protein [Pseudomonadota bacterium]
MNTFDVVRAAAGGMVVVPEKQAGEIVGGISVKTLRNLRAEGKELLPTIEIGGRRYVCISDIAEFIDQRRPKSSIPVASSTPTLQADPLPRRVGRPKKSELRKVNLPNRAGR